MAAAGVLVLRVHNLEKNDRQASRRKGTDPADAVWRRLHNGVELHGDDLAITVRCILRDEIWARLIADDGFFVHFGDDYYMYIGTNDDDFVAPPPPPGIFVEPYHSPYHDEYLAEYEDEAGN
jgi:hypothetical protein